MDDKKTIKFRNISWAIFAIISVLTFVIVTGLSIFPPAFKSLFFLVILAIVAIGSAAAFLTKGRGRKVAGIACVALSVLLAAGTIIAARLDAKARGIFTSSTGVVETEINIYARKEDNVDKNIVTHARDTFIMQTSLDNANQQFALSELEKLFGIAPNTIEKEDLISAIKAFFNKDADLFILNKEYVSMIEELEGYEDFSDRVEIIHTIVKSEKKEKTQKKRTGDITKEAFVVYVAGFDGSSTVLDIYGRVDVNILLCVNPNTKQILLVGIPRDSYVPNPALDNQFDKLTHLGWFNGVTNSMEGVGNYLGIDIDHYVTVNFYTFLYIIDAIGGVDIENPYAFYTTKSNGGLYFPEGTVHLDGKSGLHYVRERKNLAKGDFNRNEHQVLVLKAIINKVMSKEILSHYDDLLDALNGQFITDIDSAALIKLSVNQINSGKNWELITYNLGGDAAMQGTATLGKGWKLYTVNMFESQKEFVKEQVNKMMDDKVITQEELPDKDKTTYIPN